MSQPNYSATSPEGCFSGSGNLQFSARLTFDSSSSCITQCLKSQSAVAAMTERFDCWCGSQYPSKTLMVDEKRCNNPCPGYPKEACGGQDLWTVWSTGLLENPSFVGDSSPSLSTPLNTPASEPTSKSTPSGATSPQQQTITLDGSTVVKTLAPTSAPTPSNSSSGSSTGTKVGAAVGIVVGVSVLAAIIAGVYFFLRRRRQNREGHHRRNSSLNGFISSERNPPAYALSDNRLDPNMVERRQSDGSVFADNQDYSRRILKVTNPDGS